MKRYTHFDSHMWLVGILIPILMFFVSMNATYAFYTATASQQKATATTGIIRIVFDGNLTTSASGATVTTALEPGSDLVVEGVLHNSGNGQIYALLKLDITITKADATKDEITKYYIINTASTTATTDDTTTEVSASNKDAFVMNVGDKFGINIVYELDGETYGDAYQKASLTYVVNAYAVQTANMGTKAEATDILFEKAGVVVTS